MAGALGKILPLILAVIFIALVGVVAFVAYSIACEVADKTSKKMEQKNVKFSRDGLKVGVKQKSAEEVGDSTQSVLIKAWNASSWPTYKSRLGWGQTATPADTAPGQRKPFSRSSSTQ